MDTPTLPVGYFEEGRRYLGSVEGLGLRPSALFWAYDRVAESFVLVLITDVFDTVGPLELSKLLFKAYNVEATPRSIDPSILRLHSPEHAVVQEMNRLMSLNVGHQLASADASGIAEGLMQIARTVTKIDGLEIDDEWVYRFEKPLSTSRSSDVLRRWHRFEANIDRLAA